MSQAMQVVPFQYEGNSVRWGGTKDNPWFVAQDVCDILGIKTARDAISDFPVNEKGVESIYTPGGKKKVVVVYESGLYRLIFRSIKPEAEAFRCWVFQDVLPSIRKTGEYRAKQRDRYAKLGLSPEWIEQRERGIEARKTFTETLHSHGVKEGFEYARCTNAIYIPLLGGMASEIKKQRQLPVKANLRDNLSLKEILQVALIEVVAQEKIEEESRNSFPLCYNACKEVSTSIAEASNHGRQIG